MKKPKNMNAARVFLVLVCLCTAGFPAFSQDEGGFFSLQSFGIFHDTLWLGNSDKNSAPSPVLSVWGASFRFYLADSWYFAPELGFDQDLQYLYRDGVALPAEIEEANAVKTIDILFGLPVFYRFRPAHDMDVFAGTGPVFSFKIPVKTYGDISSGDVAGYFLEKGRFLHWEVSAALEWSFLEHLAFCARIRVIVPVYRFWDGDSMPLYDGLMAGGSVGLRLKF